MVSLYGDHFETRVGQKPGHVLIHMFSVGSKFITLIKDHAIGEEFGARRRNSMTRHSSVKGSAWALSWKARVLGGRLRILVQYGKVTQDEHRSSQHRL